MRGAEPGDVLKVEILAVETDGFGSTAVFPGFGLLGDLFEEPYLVTWGLHEGSATSGRLEGIRVPADPFVGVIGVAPSHERMERFRAREAALVEAGGVALPPNASGAVPAVEPYASTALRTIPPRETGGNLDVPQARAGATLFLPVDVPGALLSLGDVHFAQGDGEVCGTAIEVHGRVTLRVDVLPAAQAPLPAAVSGLRVGRAGLEGEPPALRHDRTADPPRRLERRHGHDAGGAQRRARDDRLAGRRAGALARAGLRALLGRSRPAHLRDRRRAESGGVRALPARYLPCDPSQSRSMR